MLPRVFRFDVVSKNVDRPPSLKGIVWVGVAMFAFGLASIFYPPLKLLIGSVTTSAAITVGGLALMVLPTLVVGNELLILGGVGVAVGGWFLAHRHGRLQGFVDANKNGVDDRLEKATEPRRCCGSVKPSFVLATTKVFWQGDSSRLKRVGWGQKPPDTP